MHKKSVHLKIRDWVCDVCGYAASLKQTLMAHVHLVHLKSSHSQYKEHDFTTSSRNSLKKYMLLNTKDAHGSLFSLFSAPSKNFSISVHLVMLP